MKIKNLNCSDLIGAEYNPRKLSDKQRTELKDSLNRFGFVDPVLVNINEERKNIIIGGHQRKSVWEEMGNTTIPCIELDLTLDQEKELNVRLNKSGGEFDMEMLEEHFDTDDLVSFGFDAVDFDVDFTEEPEKEQTDLSDEMIDNFKIEIELESESEQEKMFNELTEKGIQCRILTL
tara:strand:- start:1511 stop:2041 length:531 start_codon:yes stop_codon:yes gene_type:complete